MTNSLTVLIVRMMAIMLFGGVSVGCTLSNQIAPVSLSQDDGYTQGQRLYEQGAYQYAIEVFSAAIEHAPYRADLWNARGYVKMHVQNYPGAIQDFSEAMKRDQGNLRYRENFGVALLEGGKPEKALSELNKVVRALPESAHALNHRGLVYSQMGSMDQAISDFTQAVAIDNSIAVIYQNRAVAKAKTGQLKSAKEDLDQALSIDNSLAEAYESRGLLELADGEFGSAIQDFSRAISFGVQNGLVYYNRGVALSMTGDLGEAKKDYQRACENGISQACWEVVHTTAWNNEML